MKQMQQDLITQDSIYVGEYGSYKKIDDQHYLLNPVCIVATNSIIEIGKSYLICDCPSGNYIEVYDGKLLEVFKYEELVILFFQTEMSEKMFFIDLADFDDTYYPHFMIIDLDFILEEMRRKEIKKYCEKY